MRPEGFLKMILERQKTNIQSVNQKQGWEVREHCPVCQSSEKTFQFKKYEFDLYQCNYWGTAYFDQIPVEPDDVYSSESATEDAKISYLGNKDYRKIQFAQERVADCYGVELGSGFAKLTSEHLNIPVWNCDLTELEVEEKFDVITMFDLIEHVKSPVALIKSAKNHLKENGIILVFTPQYDSVAIQEMKEYSNLVMPAEHLSYFTKGTVENSLNLQILK